MKRLVSSLLTVGVLLCLALTTAHASVDTNAASLSKSVYDNAAEVAIWVADLNGNIVTKLEPNHQYTVTIDFHATSYLYKPQITLPSSLLDDGMYVDAANESTKVVVNCNVDGELWQPSCAVTSYEHEPVRITYATRSTNIQYNNQASTHAQDEEAFVLGLSPEQDLKYGDHFRVRFRVCTSDVLTKLASGDYVESEPTNSTPDEIAAKLFSHQKGEDSDVTVRLKKFFANDTSVIIFCLCVFLIASMFADVVHTCGVLDGSKPYQPEEYEDPEEAEGGDSASAEVGAKDSRHLVLRPIPADENPDEVSADGEDPSEDRQIDVTLLAAPAASDDVDPMETGAPTGGLDPNEVVRDCEQLINDLKN